MGKRSSFERREADFYPTPAKAVAPRHLEDFGLRCTYKGDICAGSDSSEMFATSDTPMSRGSRRKAGSCCLHSMARTTVSIRR